MLRDGFDLREVQTFDAREKGLAFKVAWPATIAAALDGHQRRQTPTARCNVQGAGVTSPRLRE